MMPPFVVFPTNRIAHFVEVSLYLFYLAQRVKLIVSPKTNIFSFIQLQNNLHHQADARHLFRRLP